MRLATIRLAGQRQAAVIRQHQVVPLVSVNERQATSFPTQLMELIEQADLPRLNEALEKLEVTDWTPLAEAQVLAPFLRPGKIWGIGLNYREHAGDLDETAPTTQPASFMKPATAVIGPREPICLPKGIGQVTAEAELGVIIGKRCRHVALSDVSDYIFGYCPIIDMTALDILQQNPRYLTRAKSFDTFFSFGPQVVTADEFPDLAALTIKTIINGNVIAQNRVANMTFDPFHLVSFHSRVMTLEAGDIISTGTPGAGVIQPGDVVRCEIEGFEALQNPVQAESAG